MSEPEGSGPPQQLPPSKLGVLLGPDFSLQEAIGGVRGLIESTIPGLLFVLVYVPTRSLRWAIIASVASAVVACAIRLVQRGRLTQALGGILGVGIGAMWALTTGKAQNYYAWGLLTNLAYGLVFAVSALVRWPIIGFAVGIFQGRYRSWRSDPLLVRRARSVTWLWVAMFLLRLAVQYPIYLQGDAGVGWLGTAKLVMGLPLFALVAWFSWILLKDPIRQHSAQRDSGAGAEDDPS